MTKAYGSKSPNPRRGRRLAVLCADDSRLDRAILRLMLDDEAIDLVLSEDGEAALAAMEERRFDVVFMDLSMPRLDGWEATRRIRAAGGEAGTRPPLVYAVTMTDTGTSRALCAEAGMDGFLLKPMRRHQILGVLDAARDRLEGPGPRPISLGAA